MLVDLMLATVMVVFTVLAHFFGLLFLIRILHVRGHHLRPHESILGQWLVIVVVVLGIFAIHTVEIWAYAWCFWIIGAVGPKFEVALYFSTVTFTTIGYGDIVLGEKWRVFAAIEAANGLILFGWSTAFLMSLMRQLRSLEHDWLERPAPPRR